MNILKKTLLPFAKRFWSIKLLKPEYSKVLTYVYNDVSQERMTSDIVMRVHTIEKGLSLKNVRPGFGVPKIIAILKLAEKHFRLYNDPELIVFVLSIIGEYLAFNKKNGEINEEIIERYKSLKDKISDNDFNKYSRLCGGTIHLNKQEILRSRHGEFPEFVASRHSIRSFTGKQISAELIENALRLSESTPSACNRQPWRIWSTMNKEEIKHVLELQTGARQFIDDVSCVILVTAKMTAFTSTEYHQAYVNGGMYAMNLLYSLHYQGLGAIPLNLGVTENRLLDIYNYCGIAPSNLPILLIAVGDMEEELNVPKSCRFSYNEYTTFHKK